MAKRRSVTEQARRLTKGQINRRRFIMSAVASGVTLPTATALATTAEARVPQFGGTLRIATAADSEAYVARATGNTLTRLTSAGRVAPELATRLSGSADHRTWRATLRDGVTFQDGSLVTADAVAKGYEINGTLHSLDAGTLKYHLDAPTPDFATQLADHRQIVKGVTGQTTGGYRRVETGPDMVRLARVETYWKPNAAFFDGVEVQTIRDDAARHRAVLNGAVDFADGIAPKAVATLSGLPTLSILETEGTHHLAFRMRHDVPPFDNAVLRRALATAIDPVPVLSAAALGHGYTVDHGGMPPDPAFHHAGKVPLDICDAAVPGARAAAEAIAHQAGKRGIDVEIRDVPLADWHETARRSGWYATRGLGAPSSDAITQIQLNALAAHASTLTHPEATSTVMVSVAFRIAERWWFAAPT